MGISATVSRLAVGLHTVLAPRAGRSLASYRLHGDDHELTAAFEDMRARSGVRLGSANGRFSVTAPPSTGGAFRRTLSGEAVRSERDLVLRGEYASDVFASAFFTALFLCLAISQVLVLVAALGNVLFGDPDEGWGILLSGLVLVPFAGALALIYRAGAHGGLASQELIHQELTALEGQARNAPKVA